MKKSAEERIKRLFAEHPYPPIDVIIPILEKAGRGEKELESQIYDIYCEFAKGIKEIMNLKGNDTKTLARVWEISTASEGMKMQPLELSDSRYSFSITDCPMIHVGKDVSTNVKSRFCDIVCTAGSRALMDTVLAPHKGVCAWSKTLIKGAGKCTVTFEFVKAK
jgi:hypothetical protein